MSLCLIAVLVTVPLAGTRTAVFISCVLVLLSGQRVHKYSIMLWTGLMVRYVHIVPFCSDGAIRIFKCDTEIC